MAKSLLAQLREMTTVVGDTGDIEAIEKVKPQDATTNPSLLTTAAQMPAYSKIVDDVLLDAKKELGEDADDAKVAKLAFENLAVAFGKKILQIVPGRVSTEVDARLSYDTGKTIEQAHSIIEKYESAGVSRNRVLIKIASTWPGIKAAEKLEKEGIHCNLTLLFGIHQAIACADAGVTLISPFVGRILDWYKKDTGKDYKGADDPGVQSVTKIYNYFKKFGYKTQVMGASFRNTGEIIELAGCDLLTISPHLLEELDSTEGTLVRKLDPEKAKSLQIEKLTIDEATFEKMHAADRMAHDKLKEGIEGFSKALEQLEQLLSKPFAATRAKSIDPGHANCSVAPGSLSGSDTTYLTVVDSDGNIVSFIQSNYSSFGSGITVDGMGFVLQNRGGLFSLNRQSPNALAGRKRPLHTIIPGFMQRGDEHIGFGIMGGWNQPLAHAQFVSNLVDYHMNIQAAMEEPRFTVNAKLGCNIVIESRVTPASIDALTKMGHVLEVRKEYTTAMGRGQAVLHDSATGINYGASDPRADGAAIPESPRFPGAGH